MKVLTLRQPWATLVVIGAKKIETRSFDTSYRGKILIHASAKMDTLEKVLARSEPFLKELSCFQELQLGKIIGSVTIADSHPTEYWNRMQISDKEKSFGDFGPGRYGWELKNHNLFLPQHYIPFIGGVGFTKEFDQQICYGCGCTQGNCEGCLETTGSPCYWISYGYCSACRIRNTEEYKAGMQAAVNPDTENCSFKYFNSEERKNLWQAGYDYMKSIRKKIQAQV